MIPNFINNKVLCIGEVLWDNLRGSTMPGGALLNIAHHLHKNNIPVTLVSKVGTDTKGIELLGHMKKAGLKTDAIYFDDTLPTSEVGVKIDSFNNIRYNVNEPVAWDNIKINMKIVDAAGTAGTVVYGSLASRNKVSRETINVLLDFDIVKIMDVNLRPPFDTKELVEPLLKKADIAKLTEKELQTISTWHNRVFFNEKDQLNWFSEYYECSIVCMTRENNGAMLYNNGILYQHPGYKSDPIDSIGTGAAFLAGLISSLISKKTINQSLEVACVTAALIASSEGSIPDYNLQDISNFNTNFLNK